MYSSAILGGNIPGPQGPTGPTGSIGATGNPGISGATGATGNYGKYVVWSRAEIGKITFTYSDGTTGEVIGNFYGATGYTGTTFAQNTIEVLANYNGILTDTPLQGQLNIKGISALGSLVTSIDNNNLYIDTIYDEVAGNLDSPGLSADTLMYLKQQDLASSTDIKISAYTEGRFANLDFRNRNYLNDAAVVKTVGPVKEGQLVGIYGELENFAEGTTQGIYVNIEDSSFYIVKTPIGIAGFTGSFKTNEIITAVLLIESDRIWKFPENVYFEPGENYLTCGKSLVNILTFDGGINWYATISQRGLDLQNVETCEPAINTGSCCYIEYPSNQTKCREYVTKETCDKLSGVFRPLKSCTDTCFTNPGVCCTSGKCLENVSISECEQFGGQFYSDITCNTYPNNPDGENWAENISDGRFCFDPCKEQVACCKDGVCLGNNYTRIQCEQVLGGVAIKNSNCTANKLCCDINVIGSCCLCNSQTGESAGCIDGVSKYYCDNYSTLANQPNINGKFAGENEKCNEFNCSCLCPTDPLVGCCFLQVETDPENNAYCDDGCGYSFTCQNVTVQWCLDQGGTPNPNGSLCEYNTPEGDIFGDDVRRCYCEPFSGPTVRCCNPITPDGENSGDCYLRDPCTCESLSGTPGPYGSICTPNACGSEGNIICCLNNVCVQTESQQECLDLGGVVKGEGDCADFTCKEPPPPTVACCNNGECTDKTPEECAASGGTRAPDGTSCSTYNCQNQDTPRTCCFTSFDGDVTCQDLIPSVCVEQGGVVGAENSTCAVDGCSGPDEFVACFWCFPDVTEVNPYRPGKFYNPNAPGINLNQAQQLEWIENEEHDSWIKHNIHAGQAPYRSVIIVSPEKKRLLDLSIQGVTIEWGGDVGVSADYPVGVEKPIAEMLYSEEKGYHYLENFSALPWIAEGDVRKIIGNVDREAAKNRIINHAYSQFDTNATVVMAGGTFYCSYLGSYAKKESNNKENCLKRFGYTGDYLGVATLCDPVKDEDITIPFGDLDTWWKFLVEYYDVPVGFTRVEPYQETIRNNNYAPFPPIWGRITYNNQARGCVSEQAKWTSANLNLLPQEDIISMIKSFNNGLTGPYWWKNYYSKYTENTVLFNTKVSETLNKQLGILGNRPWVLYKKSVYGNPMECGTGQQYLTALGPGRCACNARYLGCPSSPLCLTQETSDTSITPYVFYDPYALVTDVYLSDSTRIPLVGFEYGTPSGNGLGCYYSNWNDPGAAWNEEEETDLFFEPTRLFGAGKGWAQINAVGTVLYGDGSDLQTSSWNLTFDDATGAGCIGFRGQVHWGGEGCNTIYPTPSLMSQIREIYHSKPGDQGNFKRGILGRNIRYNMRSFPTSGVFFEGTSLTDLTDAWKDSSFMFWNRDTCGVRTPGTNAITVPIFGVRHFVCRNCDSSCSWGGEQDCQVTINTGGNGESCWSGWARILDPEDMNCFPYSDESCGCENRPFLSPQDPNYNNYQRGQCFWDYESTGNTVQQGCRGWSNVAQGFQCCLPASNGAEGCLIVDPCNSGFVGDGENLLGGASCKQSFFSLHYPRTDFYIAPCGTEGLNLLQNTKRVLLEDSSCVEMLCPECNNYQPCGS